MDNNEKHEYFICDCGHNDHMLYLTYWPGDADFPFLAVNVLLNPQPLYKRIPAAIRHLLGRRASYSSWDETLLTPEDAMRLAGFVGGFLAEHKSQGDT